MKQKGKLLLGAILLLSFGDLSAADRNKKTPGVWELAKTEDNISIYYRWIDLDTMKTREMRALFSIDTTVDAILPQFSDAGNYSSWAVGIKECKIYPVDDSNWVSYIVMDYPWPFKKKDLVTQCQLLEKDEETILKMLADKEFLAENPKMERIQNYQGEWKFTPGKTGQTLVEYRAISFTKPVFPRFVQDPVIQKLFIDSFQDLKRLAEAK